MLFLHVFAVSMANGGEPRVLSRESDTFKPNLRPYVNYRTNATMCGFFEVSFSKNFEKLFASSCGGVNLWGSYSNIRSSHQRCSIKKVFFKISKIQRKHLCQILFFNKVAELRRFPVDFVK